MRIFFAVAVPDELLLQSPCHAKRSHTKLSVTHNLHQTTYNTYICSLRICTMWTTRISHLANARRLCSRASSEEDPVLCNTLPPEFYSPLLHEGCTPSGGILLIKQYFLFIGFFIKELGSNLIFLDLFKLSPHFFFIATLHLHILLVPVFPPHQTNQDPQKTIQLSVFKTFQAHEL